MNIRWNFDAWWRQLMLQTNRIWHYESGHKIYASLDQMILLLGDRVVPRQRRRWPEDQRTQLRLIRRQMCDPSRSRHGAVRLPEFNRAGLRPSGSRGSTRSKLVGECTTNANVIRMIRTLINDFGANKYAPASDINIVNRSNIANIIPTTLLLNKLSVNKGAIIDLVTPGRKSDGKGGLLWYRTRSGMTGAAGVCECVTATYYEKILVLVTMSRTKTKERTKRC